MPSHTPVLTEEVISFLAVQPGRRYVDCTIGPGGHSRAILDASAPGGVLLGLDADPAAIELASEALSDFAGSIRLVNGNFRDLRDVCNRYEFEPVHGVLFDLGVSSLQLGSADRGFSFQTEAPLDMRFGPDQALTAAEIVNEYSDTDLSNVIWQYGEERASRRIARRIVAARPISTTTELARIVAKAIPGGRKRIHPATRTFQALRIAVNDELTAIAEALDQARDVLGSGGRMVVISFHSLEDRIVKQFMQRESRDCICPPEIPVCSCDHKATLKVLTKRPVKPGDAEVSTNPRSRSARLRAAERLPVEVD
ncbi:MAG: 16S rRNA (cytosine(1402)-N(4))-methyltransferase RsmH [Chloroflexi bacterium]|nr:16S rRNA (cytosine(1402)-N(4))-methyltransferase RsmH [Chloroflexota bacterium]